MRIPAVMLLGDTEELGDPARDGVPSARGDGFIGRLVAAGRLDLRLVALLRLIVGLIVRLVGRLVVVAATADERKPRRADARACTCA